MNEASSSYENPDLSRQLKALAIALLQDEAAADDIVQEVWLASLKRPPSSYSDRKAWLMAVTKNLARSEIRSRVHRRDRERSVAVPEATLESIDGIERASVRERLVEAVRELDQPYAAVVHARFIEEYTPAEIAANEGCALATIRTRLHRGIQKLRARLEAEYGGSAAFGVALVGAFDWSPGDLSSPASTAPGAGARRLWGGASPVVVSIAALLTAIGVFVAVALLRAEGDAEVDQGDLVEVAGGVPQLQGDLGQVNPVPVPETREEGPRRTAPEAAPDTALALGGAVESEADTADSAPSTRMSGVARFRVVDENMLPVIGARILVAKDMLGSARATTDSKGDASLDWTEDDLSWFSDPDIAGPGADRLTLIAHADGYAASVLIRLLPSELTEKRIGLVVSRPGHDVFGRVLDSNGHGVEGARISVVGSQVTAADLQTGGVGVTMSIDTLSGADGSYQLHGLTPDESHIVCRVPGVGVASGTVDRAGADPSAIELDLELVPGSTLKGTFTTDDGRPLEGVEVSYELRRIQHATSFSARSGAGGTYELGNLPAGEFTVRMKGAGMDRYARVKMRAGETTRHDATLVAGRGFKVSVVDTDGEPIERAWVGAQMRRANWYQGLRTDADGEVTFVDHPPIAPAAQRSKPGGPIEVTVKGNAANGALILMGAVEVTSIPTGPLVIECNPDFSNLRSVIGVIVDHKGAALADADAFLCGAWPHPLMGADVRSSDGSFEFRDIRPGPYDLFVRTSGAQHFHVRAIEVESDPTNVGMHELPAPALVDIDWAWDEGEEAARFQIHERVVVGASTFHGMVAGGGSESQSFELMPGRYTVYSLSRSGDTIEQRALHCRSGDDVVVYLGPDSPQRCHVTIDCKQVRAPEMKVTVRAVYREFFAQDATDEALEEACLDSELLFDGTAVRSSRGHYEYDFEFEDAGTFITRFVAPDGRVAYEHSVMREFLQLHCADRLSVTFD